MKCDAHVQAYVRDRVHVLEMMEELLRLRNLRTERESKAQARKSAHTVVCTRAAVRTDGEVVYLDLEKRARVVPF